MNKGSDLSRQEEKHKQQGLKLVCRRISKDSNILNRLLRELQLRNQTERTKACHNPDTEVIIHRTPTHLVATKCVALLGYREVPGEGW